MPRPSPLPHRFSTGPFAYRDALEHGVTAGRTRRSDLIAPYRGVRHPVGDLDIEARCRTFQLRMPRNGFFNSVTAAVLLGISLPLGLERASTIHVAVPASARATQTVGVIGHKVTLMGEDVGDCRGLRVTSPQRTFCELAAELSVPDLVAAGDWLIHWRHPLCTIESLTQAVARYPGRRGRPALRAALGMLDDHAESPPESRMRAILALGGVDGFVTNLTIRAGGRVFRGDLAFPKRRLIIEYQGDYHRDPAQWRLDMSRRGILASSDWQTLEINTDDLKHHAGFVALVLATLRTRPTFG